MSQSEKRKLCIAVFSPMLSGLYYPKFVLHLIQLCQIKRYRIKIFKTGGYGEYDSQLGLSDVDIIILLRNSVHLNWVKALREQGKVVVSISYDYFPLDVPCISSDHNKGVQLAFSELSDHLQQGLTFVGNLNNYDIRKRYESALELAEKHELSEHNLFVYPIADDLIGGGYEAAKRFVAENCQAQAIMFGTTMNAIGFIRYLREMKPEMEARLSIVSFDASSLVPVVDPKISAIDQNINLVTHKALTVGEQILYKGESNRKYEIPPRLIPKTSDIEKSADEYITISPERRALSNPNYMKCLLYNIQEWSESIALSNLDSIMMLKTLFPYELDLVLFNRFVFAGHHKSLVKTLKTIDMEAVKLHPPTDTDSLIDEYDYPGEKLLGAGRRYDKEVHVLMAKEDKTWGLLSLMSQFHTESTNSSIIGLFSYIDWIVNFITQKGSITPLVHPGQEQSDQDHEHADIIGVILWNAENNQVHWDDNALSLLGFESGLDQGVYRNMEVYDRVHDQDTSQLRTSLIDAAHTAFQQVVRFRHKDKTYYKYVLSSDGAATDNVIRLVLKSC